MVYLTITASVYFFVRYVNDRASRYVVRRIFVTFIVIGVRHFMFVIPRVRFPRVFVGFYIGLRVFDNLKGANPLLYGFGAYEEVTICVGKGSNYPINNKAYACEWFRNTLSFYAQNHVRFTPVHS